MTDRGKQAGLALALFGGCLTFLSDYFKKLGQRTAAGRPTE